MDDIPSGFFKLPELEYCHLKPNIPYNYGTSGLLHSKKFRSILKRTLEGEILLIHQILNGHVLSTDLRSMGRREIADFCRHILIINRDKIGWQTVDKYLTDLTKKVGPPTWDLPNFIFTEDFNQIFSSMLRWELTREQQKIFLKYFRTKGNPYLSSERHVEKLQSNNQFWNIKHLFLLLEGLVEQFKLNRKEFEEFRPILNSLSELLIDEIRSNNRELQRRITLLTLFSRALVDINFNYVQVIQDLINRLWLEVGQNFDQKDVDAYRYIFAVIYGYIGTTYYQHNIGFIEKRIFLKRILGSFFSFKRIEIGEWLENFVNSNVHELVIEYILHGYLNIVNLLDQYALELPESDDLTETKELVLTASNSLFKMAEKYLIRLMGQNILKREILHKIKQIKTDSGEKTRIIDGMIHILKSCLRYLIYYDSEMEIDKELIKTVGKLSYHIDSEEESDLFTAHLLILKGEYPFEKFFTKIKYEVKETSSIVNSFTFEEEIIVLASKIMDQIKDTYQKSNQIKIEVLEELFYYISQWFQYFERDDELFQEILMISSPILSIILVQLIQGYYEQNKNGNTLIIYLTMQHFVNIIRDEMILETGAEQNKTMSYLANDFRSMINEWRISALTDIKSIANNIKKMEFTGTDKEAAVGGMLADELVMGYLRMINELEETVISSDEEIDLVKLANTLYEPPKKGIHIFERIGIHVKEPLKFPLIRNYHKYNAAMSVIPFEFNISSYSTELDIDSMISHFFTKDDEQ